MAIAYLEPKDYLRQTSRDEAPHSEVESCAYTKWLATHHYENFHIVSFLLPKRLHQDFYNVYAFCRWADDLGDEIGDREESLSLLGWWRQQLNAMYAGHAFHPVFVALRSTISKFEIPSAPFEHLIEAFEQDQRVNRYESWEDLFGYCANSANPVGHLVLYLCGYRDEERQRLSDFTCTALQLANFWQDVVVDLEKDRVYLPMCLLQKYRYGIEELLQLKFDGRFREVMTEAVDVADKLFKQGLPLIKTVDRRLALDLELFSRGGMRVLHKIRRQGYDVLKARPVISKWERVGILSGCLLRRVFV
jgi:squalene synthase HpnC